MGDFVLNTDFSTISPDEGGVGRRYFPVSDSKGWLVVMSDAEPKETNDKEGSGLAITLLGQEGPIQGKEADWWVTTANKSQKAVEIGRAQISAIAHCIGHLRVGNISELYNKPFRVVVVLDTQKEDTQQRYPGSTRISVIHDVHGNTASKAGQGALTGGGGGGNFGGNQNQQQQQRFDQNQGGNNGGGNFGGNGGGNFQQQNNNGGGGNFGGGNGGGGFDPNANNNGGNGNVQSFNPNQNQQQQNNNQGGNFQQQGNNNGGGNFQQQQNNGGGAGPGWGNS